ncbi:MAG: rod-binding protein [Lachnospiraceae bacterium]|nr:rod-binding protein [Lachnospiraceae bacterium]
MDMIGATGSTDYASIISQSAHAGNLEHALNQKLTTDDEMMEACKEFEAYMLEQIYKGMEKTIIRADEEENDYEQYFGDLRTQELAKQATEQGGIGLAKELYEAMKRNYGI